MCGREERISRAAALLGRRLSLRSQSMMALQKGGQACDTNFFVLLVQMTEKRISSTFHGGLSVRPAKAR